MSGASFDDVLEAGLLQVGGYLSMASKPPNMLTIFKKDVNLNGAKITGTFDVNGASFEGKVNADSLKVGGDLFMRYACHADKGVMAFANVGGNLDLRSASLADADFSGASVAGELRLGGQKFPHCRTGSGTPPDVLNLRNAKVGNLMVASDALTAPQWLRLDGFSFGRVGGFEGDTEPQQRRRSIKWWDNWARLDPDYSPTPYAQLAAAFTNSGDRDAANDIRYLDRARQREVACEETWLRGSCVLQTALGAVAGYGIGSHTFIVLPWVLGFWLAGAALLWWTVPAAKHKGAVWCCCASLAQLLPVIPINKELTAFFDDPERARLKRLASLRILRPRRRWSGTGHDPAHRRLGAHPQLLRLAILPRAPDATSFAIMKRARAILVDRDSGRATRRTFALKSLRFLASFCQIGPYRAIVLLHCSGVLHLALELQTCVAKARAAHRQFGIRRTSEICQSTGQMGSFCQSAIIDRTVA